MFFFGGWGWRRVAHHFDLTSVSASGDQNLVTAGFCPVTRNTNKISMMQSADIHAGVGSEGGGRAGERPGSKIIFIPSSQSSQRKQICHQEAHADG